ncbi:MAG TPA: DUF4129 domain-containing protein, partial [Pyrinomonadaceae bacterium]|nr:DUF4129 domain-containing protein [Pyrinomonadaceae bacterium]
VFDYGRVVTNLLTTIRSYLTKNVLTFVVGMIVLVVGLTLLFFGRRLWQLVWRRDRVALEAGNVYSTVQFYEKLMQVMEQRGVPRNKDQTPLEFADKLKSKDVMTITRAYNRVRYGGERLSASERQEVERALVLLEAEHQG